MSAAAVALDIMGQHKANPERLALRFEMLADDMRVLHEQVAAIKPQSGDEDHLIIEALNKIGVAEAYANMAKSRIEKITDLREARADEAKRRRKKGNGSVH